MFIWQGLFSKAIFSFNFIYIASNHKLCEYTLPRKLENCQGKLNIRVNPGYKTELSVYIFFIYLYLSLSLSLYRYIDIAISLYRYIDIYFFILFYILRYKEIKFLDIISNVYQITFLTIKNTINKPLR